MKTLMDVLFRTKKVEVVRLELYSLQQIRMKLVDMMFNPGRYMDPVYDIPWLTDTIRVDMDNRTVSCGGNVLMYNTALLCKVSSKSDFVINIK